MPEQAVHPGDVIPETDAAREEANALARDALELFLDRQGKLYPRDEAVAIVKDGMDVETARAQAVLSSLVGDIVDPVQQVAHPDALYVGVIEYSTYPDAGAYRYVHYSDRFGERKRVVCARCVEAEERHEHVAHATAGEGTMPEDASWDRLLNRVTEHYATAHERGPESVEPGASLVSGTTMGGNQAWHQGNVTGGAGITVGTQSVALTADGHDNDEHSQNYSSQQLSDRRLAITRRIAQR